MPPSDDETASVTDEAREKYAEEPEEEAEEDHLAPS